MKEAKVRLPGRPMPIKGDESGSMTALFRGALKAFRRLSGKPEPLVRRRRRKVWIGLT